MTDLYKAYLKAASSIKELSKSINRLKNNKLYKQQSKYHK